MAGYQSLEQYRFMNSLTDVEFVIPLKIVKTEADVLKTLNFEMGNPTTKTFLRLRLVLMRLSYWIILLKT